MGTFAKVRENLATFFQDHVKCFTWQFTDLFLKDVTKQQLELRETPLST